LKNDALAPPMPADLKGDYLSDSLYLGNLYGYMYRVKNIGKGMVPEISKLYENVSGDQSNPIRAKADYAYTIDENLIRVYFGTGIYERQVDKYASEQQFFFGLKDNYTSHKTYKYTDADLAKLTAVYVTDEVTGKTFRDITGTNANKDSWVIGLDNTTPGLLGSERVITQPLVVAGLVFFASFIPDEDVCEGNGRSWLFAVDYETGLAPTEPVFDINEDGVIDDRDVVKIGETTLIPAAVSLGAGQPSKPVLHKDTMFVTTTGGGLASLKVNLSKQLTTITSWSEK
jgi:type IV pilus assembly protein PilY1